MKMKNILLTLALLGSLASLYAQNPSDTQEKKTTLSTLKNAKQLQQKKIQKSIQPVIKQYDSYNSKEVQSYKYNNSSQTQIQIPTH